MNPKRFIAQLNRKQKAMLRRIFAGIVVYIGALILPEGTIPKIVCFLAAYAAVGWKVLSKAGKNIVHGKVFDENFLMGLASLGAIVVGEYSEAVAVMLFYQIGELFESCAVGASRRSISELMDIRPDSARVERSEGLVEVDPEEVNIGDFIVLRPGERVPLDGTVIEGNSAIDTSALTGEALPAEIHAGDSIYSGSINISGVLRIRVEKPYAESTVARILDLVENAAGRKARTENFITRFAAVYTPAVCVAALMLALVPSLITGAWNVWPMRALTFLVVSCPCALVISIPLSFFGGIGGASASGILIKGSSYMETLSKVDCVVFDKTGTITRGSFDVTEVNPIGIDKEKLIELAAYAESNSNHPIALSIVKAYGKEIDADRIGTIREIAGQGIVAEIDGKSIACGNDRLMDSVGANCLAGETFGTVVYVAEEGAFCGHIVISDTVKPRSRETMALLKKCGIARTVMLTGDRRETADRIAREVGIDEVHSELLPADKVDCVEKMIADGRKVAFAGDGINDAPVLARADIGIAMGALGSDAAIEAADVVLMDDDPGKVASAIDISRRTLRIVKQNIVFALGIKLIVLILGALGITGMWAAVFADVGVSVIAILNAMRALKFR